MEIMESLASHVKDAANEQISIPTNIEAKDHNLLTGEGITAVVEGKRVYVGNKNEKMLFQRIIDMYQRYYQEVLLLL